MRRALPIAFAIAVCTLSGVAAYVAARPAVAGWREVASPFYHADASQQAARFAVTRPYPERRSNSICRPKIDFLDADTQVTHDSEVNRLTDLDLISARFVAAGTRQGRPNRPGAVKGKSELQTSDAGSTPHTATALAVSRRCRPTSRPFRPTKGGAFTEFSARRSGSSLKSIFPNG